MNWLNEFFIIILYIESFLFGIASLIFIIYLIEDSLHSRYKWKILNRATDLAASKLLSKEEYELIEDQLEEVMIASSSLSDKRQFAKYLKEKCKEKGIYKKRDKT